MQAIFASVWTLLGIIGYFSLWGFGQTIQHDPATWFIQLVIAIILLGVPATIMVAAVKATKI